MRKISPSGLKIFGLICVGGLLVAGFSAMAGQYAVSQLQDHPLNLKVDVLQQSRGTSCGEAVIAMVYNYAHPKTPITEGEVIEYASAEGYYTDDLPPFTSQANMVKIARHYADNVSSGAVLTANQGLGLLVRKLEDGQPVVIDVLSDFTDPASEAHFVVVTGISADDSAERAAMIHYNDPLTGTKESAPWTGREGLWNAWQNNGDPGGSGWWMVVPTP